MDGWQVFTMSWSAAAPVPANRARQVLVSPDPTVTRYFFLYILVKNIFLFNAFSLKINQFFIKKQKQLI